MIVKFSIYEELDSVEDLEKDLIKVSGKKPCKANPLWMDNEWKMVCCLKDRGRTRNWWHVRFWLLWHKLISVNLRSSHSIISLNVWQGIHIFDRWLKLLQTLSQVLKSWPLCYIKKRKKMSVIWSWPPSHPNWKQIRINDCCRSQFSFSFARQSNDNIRTHPSSARRHLPLCNS